MKASFTVVLMAASAMTAPFQCSRDPDPKNRIEETPGEALYQLAQELRAKGNSKGWRDTLSYLVRRYPSSRYARIAKDELAAAETGDAPK